MKIAAGTILVLETGEYSDYTFSGPFRVLRDFDQTEVVAAHVAQWIAPNDWEKAPDTDSFMGWLSSERYIEPIDGVVSWYIGSYGRLEPVIQKQPATSV